MNIEAFLLCDAATDQQGKLNVLGAFDNIFAKQLPAVHPACAIATRVRFDSIEEGPHSVRIQIIDQDGRNIGPKLEGNIAVRLVPNLDSTVTNFVLNIQGLEFKQYGKYRIDLAIDGDIKASLPLQMSKVPSQA
jgi:carbon monoxide dehydrogenase subunit G